ncbi:MAG: hypothetical protein JWO02_1052 [Solirubrobacterales bacterium]|nr:hypothetical protein [Solirubrobacterales bacterium]
MPGLRPAQFVFAYGSLVAAPGAHALRRDGNPAGFVADLHGHRRAWTVAMDNTHVVPGYKRYVDRVTGEPADANVAFLDVAAAVHGTVNGVCLPVTAAGLAHLDRRERNYERADVTELVADAPGHVWTYRGSVAGRARHRAGLRGRRLVVVRGYVELVLAAFGALGAAELESYRATTAVPGYPELDLVREDLPPW